MRLAKIFRNYLVISILVLSFGFRTEVKSQERGDKKHELVSIKLSVTNEQGASVENAIVTIGGVVQGYTDKNGLVSIGSLTRDVVIITKTGYADYSAQVDELVKTPAIRLEKAEIFLSSRDNIPMPFMDIKKRYSTSSAYVLKGEELEKYPTIDIRNSFTGLVPGLSVYERNGAPGMQAEEKLGVFGSSEKVLLRLRGVSPIYIIDDVPVDVSELQIEPMEIESVTIIKDIVGKAMYGPMAAAGIIFIRTKMGKAVQNALNVNTESGISFVDRFPTYTKGSEYAILNNLARTNSGINPLYSNDDIAAYAKNDAYDMYHPSINYRDMMLRNSRNIRKASVSYKGGDQQGFRFFTNLGYSGEDDIYKIGPTADYNRLNVRSNLDIPINKVLTVKLKVFGGLTIRRSPNYGYNANAGSDASSDVTMDILEFNSVIDDSRSISPISFPVYAKNDPAKNISWYAEDPHFKYNPVGRLTSNGSYTEYGRTGAAQIALDYDMKQIVEGLKSKTFASFDIFNLVRMGKAEQYIAYYVNPSITTSGADTILLTKAHDGIQKSDLAKLHDYYYQRFGVYQNFNYEKAIGSNSFLQSSLTFELSQFTRDQLLQPQRQQNVILSSLFTHKDKFSVQGVLNYSGNSSLPKGRRYSLFPSIGAGWVLSGENFLSGNTVINFLKLRGEAGILGFNNFDSPFLYQDNWAYNSSGGSTGAAPTGYWFGSTTVATPRSSISRIGNPNLGWEKRKEIEVGLDALMFDHKLAVEVSYYNNLRDGILALMSNDIPYTTGASSMYYDNNNIIRYYGVESSISYTSKVGAFKYSITGNTIVQNSKIVKYDEPEYYRFDYQSRLGQPADSYLGLTYLGKFASDAETTIIPQAFDERLKAGDLKYKDLNGDGVIDNNDVSVIGHTSPRLAYALNVKLNYRNFDLTMIADGIAFVDLPLTNSYFFNGWEDNNYSSFVRDNINGAYPRLSYYKVNNNFQASDFWLTKGGYFKIQNVELAYTLSPGNARKLYAKGVRFFTRGANLLTVTKVKHVDPESPDSGVELYPLYRTFTAGINLTF